jgi:hypothetical protein
MSAPSAGVPNSPGPRLGTRLKRCARGAHHLDPMNVQALDELARGR